MLYPKTQSPASERMRHIVIQVSGWLLGVIQGSHEHLQIVHVVSLVGSLPSSPTVLRIAVKSHMSHCPSDAPHALHICHSHCRRSCSLNETLISIDQKCQSERKVVPQAEPLWRNAARYWPVSIACQSAWNPYLASICSRSQVFRS